MHRILSELALVFVTATAHAFTLSPQIIAVANQQHSEELTLRFLPGYNTVAAETSIRFNLEHFGWVEVLPSPPASGVQTSCELIGGVARATLLSASGGALPTMYAIPVCRFRLRPHSKTPRGNYYVVESGGFIVLVDGGTRPAGSSTLRVIVD
jgi:hypothetical protein